MMAFVGSRLALLLAAEKSTASVRHPTNFEPEYLRISLSPTVVIIAWWMYALSRARARLGTVSYSPPVRMIEESAGVVCDQRDWAPQSVFEPQRV